MIRLERVTRTVTSGAERLTILDSVDLFIPAGQFVAVTGASGSGKSTLLSLVAGLDAPTSGEIIEYGVLGLLAGLVGSCASIAVTWAMSRWGNQPLPWHFHPGINAAGALVTAALVLLVGIVATWDVAARKPLGTLKEQ